MQAIENRASRFRGGIRLGHSGSIFVLWPVFSYLQIDHLSKQQVVLFGWAGQRKVW